MKSPFPGMDPYLEQYWRDARHRPVTYACGQLQPRLPAELRARAEERVFVEGPEAEVRTVCPDVHVTEREKPRESGAAAVEELTITAPLVVRVPDEPMPQGYMEIVKAASGNRVITIAGANPTLGLRLPTPLGPTSGCAPKETADAG